VPVTRAYRVTTLEEATRAAREIGYPIVLKALSDDIPHKTELGLVAVGLANDEDLARAFHGLQERLDRLEPRPSDAALLVQEFVPGGIEVFAGISRDPDFGLTLAFGMGGIAIEITRDFALRTLPLREGDAEAMIAETRGAAMLGRSAAGRRPTSRVSPPASMRLPTSATTMPICSTRSISIRSRRCPRAAAASWWMP
jgi:Acyl-CoA synthetase (NDP forming)